MATDAKLGETLKASLAFIFLGNRELASFVNRGMTPSHLFLRKVTWMAIGKTDGSEQEETGGSNTNFNFVGSNLNKKTYIYIFHLG